MASLEGRKACLLAHQGPLAFERDLAKAMWLAGEVETLAKQTVMSHRTPLNTSAEGDN